MHPQSVKTLVQWFAKYKMQVSERDFFQMAYYNIYKTAEPRCEWCFELYLRKGIVPLFVRQFIQEHFVTKGQGNESDRRKGTQNPHAREGVHLYCVR